MNRSTLDEAAAKWLPWDWNHSGTSNLLGLALWGIAEGGLGRGRYFEQIEAAIVRLGYCHPAAASSWIECSSDDDSAVSLDHDQLLAAESTEDAAILVIDAIYWRLVAEKPFPPRAIPLGT